MSRMAQSPAAAQSGVLLSIPSPPLTPLRGSGNTRRTPPGFSARTHARGTSENSSRSREPLTQYSHSRLSSFENCPRQFAYRYVEKVEVETEGVEAFLGKRVHEILERLNHHVARYGRPPSLRQVLERFRADWQAAWHAKIQIVHADVPPAAWEERGVRCLENYYRGYYPFSDGASVGIEERLQFWLDGAKRYRLVGIVDRIVSRGDGRYEIHDYKTGNRLPTQGQID